MNPTWIPRHRDVIPPPLLQVIDDCWAISFTHQFEAQLKLSGYLDMTEHLSVQEVFNVLPLPFREKNGGLLCSLFAHHSLVNRGTVLEQHCPHTSDLNTNRPTQDANIRRYKPSGVKTHFLYDYLDQDRVFGGNRFEQVLENLLIDGPVTARIPMCRSYRNTAGTGGIYNPTYVEITAANYEGLGHFLLLTEPAVLDGIKVWVAQDSAGTDWGVNGIVFLRRGVNLITEFTEMRVAP